MYLADTIVAPATPPGESALAIVRMSGPAAAELAASCHDGTPPLPRHAWHGDYHDRQGRLIDDVVFCFFPKPNSYTGEDVLEISSHGNPLIVSRIVEDAVGRGCRIAEPGEFTKRAFLNGRLDLTEAEAVMDLIQARSDRALEAAQRQLRGALRERIDAMVNRLLDLSADVEAHVDFPEEDLPAAELSGWLGNTRAIARDLRAWAATRREGDRLRDGVKVVLLGEPNAGKSSLLNRLIGFERAIVSEEPGTTRDFLEERLALGGWGIRVFDTAGLREPEGLVERAGVEKTIAQAQEADVLVFVADATRQLGALQPAVRVLLESQPVLVVQNKSDLQARMFHPTPLFHAHDVIEVSARTGAGLETFRDRLIDVIRQLSSDATHDEYIAVNARHEAGLLEAAGALDRAVATLERRAEIDLIAVDIRAAIDALGQIVGRIDHEKVLDRLFSRFCIGK